MKEIVINNKNYIVNDNEFFEFKHEEYNFLKIYPEVGILERHIGLLNDIGDDIFQNKKNLIIFGNNYGDFVKDSCYSHFNNVSVYNSDTLFDNTGICYLHHDANVDHKILLSLPTHPFILAPKTYINVLSKNYKCIYQLSRLTSSFDSLEYYYLFVPREYHVTFLKHFYYYLTNNDPTILEYNNLINFCVMVKNGGDLFEKMLIENLPIIDRWTILDTGSTDNTIEIIQNVLQNKKGKLYQEPFINFRDSRNRCLDLAGKSCKFNVMLDDTYVARGDFRKFLEVVRGDQFADSFSLVIQSDDMEYYSNRVTKSEKDLRYMYKIHEVIRSENNTNVVIPKSNAYIYDYRADYMEKRTMDRKIYDLQLLFEEVEENPDDPRHYYYLAQTYNLLEDHENAAKYFLKRAFHKNIGFLQEKVDALFEAARCYNFKLNKPWEEIEPLYKLCYEWEPERPDSLYFLGINYFLKGDENKAYEYFEKAFEIGYPITKQYSLKPTLSFHYTPKFLAQLCLKRKNYKLGYKCTSLFLQHNKEDSESFETMLSMHKLFEHVLNMPPLSNTPIESETPIVAFIVDGGYSNWTGSDINRNGVGGSETWAIETARNIQKNYDVNVVVFCKCTEEEIFEGVRFKPITEIYTYFTTYKIHICVVSRFTEYLSCVMEGFTENVFLILHDLGPIGNVIPVSQKFRKIICLSEWHKDYFLQSFPSMKLLTTSHHYGLDTELFSLDDYNFTNIKTPYKFIYSSFPNRGLIVLLKMWSRLKEILPQAELHLYCDVNGSWVSQNFPEEMNEIKNLINSLQDIYYHGWVSKSELAKAWKSSDIWFYPCKFAETFCLTALEAAASKTFVITNGLAALENTVGDRGLIIPGDVTTEEWQNNALLKIKLFFENFQNGDNTKQELIMKNYEWSKQHTWKLRSQKLFDDILNVEYENFEEIEDRVLGSVENPPLQEFAFEDFLNDKSVVVDIGSFNGENTKNIAKHCGLVYAFEPFLPSYEKCKRTIDKITNIVLENKAVSNENKTFKLFYFDRYAPDANFLHINGNIPSFIAVEQEETECVTLDNYISDKIDVINIDLINDDEQVANILKGAQNIIEKYRPIIVLPSSVKNLGNFIQTNYEPVKKMDNKVVLQYKENYKYRNIVFRVDIPNHFNIMKIGAFRGMSTTDLTNNIIRGVSVLRNILVEPVEKHYDFLVESYKNINPNNENVYIKKALIKDETQTSTKFYVISEETNLSNLPSDIEGFSSIDKEYTSQGYDVNVREIEVNATTINSIISEYDIRSLDLLHIDTGVSDFDILESLDLEKLKPNFIICNLGMKEEERLGRFFDAGYICVTKNDKETWLYNKNVN